MSRPFYTLTQADVGQAMIRAFGRPWMVSDFIGRVLPGDVGKRVYQIGGILQVESDDQRNARLRYRLKRDTTIGYLEHLGKASACRITLPAGTAINKIEGPGGGFAVADVKLLIRLTGNAHDPIYRYAWVKPEDVEQFELTAK